MKDKIFLELEAVPMPAIKKNAIIELGKKNWKVQRLIDSGKPYYEWDKHLVNILEKMIDRDLGLDHD